MGRIVGTYLHGALEHEEVLTDLGIAAHSPSATDQEALVNWFAPFGDRFEELFL